MPKQSAPCSPLLLFHFVYVRHVGSLFYTLYDTTTTFCPLWSCERPGTTPLISDACPDKVGQVHISCFRGNRLVLKLTRNFFSYQGTFENIPPG